ncbi:MAG: aldo/keto reductase [Actinobacteria bacterium]|nr:aldo/keto reductase [Actinomycetota bacterium]
MNASAAGTFTLGNHVVNRMGFGAMRITGQGVWGPPPDPEAAKKVLHRVLDLGVNLIDTADSYGPAVSEELIAAALHPYPRDLVVATKGGLVRPGPGRWDADCRPEHLREACDASLNRLKVDRITLYQLHTIDAAVPLEDSVGTLAELKQEGKIEHVGLSNVSVEQLRRALRIDSVVSVQNRYNVSDRHSETVLDECEQRGIGFLPWFPLANRSLTGETSPLDVVAKRLEATAGQVALAWLLHRSPVMLPIPGTSSIDHLEENVAAAALQLSDDDMKSIEESA